MKKQDYISIAITFTIGCLGGIYLFLTGFAPMENKTNLPDAVALAQFVMVSDVYGGCRESCPSFQVVNDGSYRYMYTPNFGEDQVVRQGTLPISYQRQLKNALSPEDLKAQARPINPAMCNNYTDGIDVIYDITLAGEQYILDSCGTDVNTSGALWIALNNIWDYLETL